MTSLTALHGLLQFWGEALMDFVASMEAHAEQRFESPDVFWWCCESLLAVCALVLTSVVLRCICKVSL